jgi:hypothetical protein
VAGKTQFLCDRVLSLLTGVSAAGFPETWVNLFKTLPTGDSAAGILPSEEWTGGGTTRIRVYPNTSAAGYTAGDPYWSALQTEGNLRFLSNAATISWTTAATWVDLVVLGIGIWDASADGNLLYWEAFDNTRLIAVDEEFILPVNRFKVRED